MEKISENIVDFLKSYLSHTLSLCPSCEWPLGDGNNQVRNLEKVKIIKNDFWLRMTTWIV